MMWMSPWTTGRSLWSSLWVCFVGATHDCPRLWPSYSELRKLISSEEVSWTHWGSHIMLGKHLKCDTVCGIISHCSFWPLCPMNRKELTMSACLPCSRIRKNWSITNIQNALHLHLEKHFTTSVSIPRTAFPYGFTHSWTCLPNPLQRPTWLGTLVSQNPLDSILI